MAESAHVGQLPFSRSGYHYPTYERVTQASQFGTRPPGAGISSPPPFPRQELLCPFAEPDRSACFLTLEMIRARRMAAPEAQDDFMAERGAYRVQVLSLPKALCCLHKK